MLSTEKRHEIYTDPDNLLKYTSPENLLKSKDPEKRHEVHRSLYMRIILLEEVKR